MLGWAAEAAQYGAALGGAGRSRQGQQEHACPHCPEASRPGVLVFPASGTAGSRETPWSPDTFTSNIANKDSRSAGPDTSISHRVGRVAISCHRWQSGAFVSGSFSGLEENDRCVTCAVAAGPETVTAGRATVPGSGTVQGSLACVPMVSSPFLPAPRAGAGVDGPVVRLSIPTLPRAPTDLHGCTPGVCRSEAGSGPWVMPGH